MKIFPCLLISLSFYGVFGILMNGEALPEVDIIPEGQAVWSMQRHLDLRLPFDWTNAVIQVGVRPSRWPITFVAGDSNDSLSLPVFFKNCANKPVGDKNISGMIAYQGGTLGWVFLPPKDERRAIKISNNLGDVLLRTPQDFNFEHPKLNDHAWRHWEQDGRECLSLMAGDNEEYDEVTLGPLLRSATPGRWMVKITQRLYIINTNRVLEGVSLPPIEFAVTVLPNAANVKSR